MSVDREDWSGAVEPADVATTGIDAGGAFDYAEPDPGKFCKRTRSANLSPASGETKPAKSRSSAQKNARSTLDFVGSSAVMKTLREEIELFAEEDEPVLISGETGSGKEAVATELHRLSPRSAKPFLVRNVSGVSAELAGSEFFGHVKGAFTGAVEKREGVFALADGGSLHLDEIGDLPMGVQAQLLRVLEDGVVTPVGGAAQKTVNVRIIAATHVDLKSAVAENKFRQDLYHRLNVLRINVPPLRQRGDDVIELANYWLAKRAAKRGCTFKLSSAAADLLRAHSWPGNVRELKNVVTSAAVLARAGKISTEHIRIDRQNASGQSDSLKIGDAKDLIARYLAAKALERSGGNATKAAKLTGLGRSTFMMLKQNLNGDCARVDSLEAQLRTFIGLKG